ncbi:hypothetical protein ACVR0S_04530 [Streptococcus dentapri]|uniref:LXG domain-containing protein n=1 Tax=Streptococcus dentapri TaxID=573564 RepID=A0ABV8CZP5_9STRE
MSIDMYLEKSQAQAASAKAMAQQEIQAYEELEAALEDFENSQADLKGKAYDSARRYSASVLRPLVMIGKQLSQTVSEAVQRFPEAYMEQVAQESLKESELEMSIAELDLRISNARDAVDAMNLDRHDANEGARLNSYHRMIDAAESSRRVLEDKLEKLRVFNATSPQIFSEIDALKAALDRGFALAEQSWDSQTGTFKSVGTQWLSELKVEVQKVAKELTLSKEEREAFKNMMETQYGFSAEEADIMLDVYVGLVKEYDGDKDKANQQFFVYMGSFVYGDSYIGGYAWSYIGGLIKPDEVEKKLKDLGISPKKIETLKTAILNQSAVAGLNGTTEAEQMKELRKAFPKASDDRLKTILKQYGGKTDFAHTSATVSAIRKIYSLMVHKINMRDTMAI